MHIANSYVKHLTTLGANWSLTALTVFLNKFVVVCRVGFYNLVVLKKVDCWIAKTNGVAIYILFIKKNYLLKPLPKVLVNYNFQYLFYKSVIFT